ncbi:MAG: hypothetical protein SGJ18_08740 [Pseudomonadota bacterium]|nr:hypothetical protein [Pseudomonadota bacterium]
MKKIFILMGLLVSTAAWSAENFEGVSAEQIENTMEADFIAQYGEDGIREGEVHPHRVVVCASQNARGFIYKSSGYLPRKVQARAQNKCEYYSRVCRPLGCR